MNGGEEPVEIEVEPEIQNILPFEDFYIDQFVDYLESDVNGNGNDASSQLGNHDKHQLNNSHYNYQCTVCRETLGSGTELLRHVRTHTRSVGSHERNCYDLKKINKKCCICMRSFDHPTMLRVHEETQHLPPFRCRYCNSYHTALKYYKMHLKLHQSRLSSSATSSHVSHVPEQSSMSTSHQQNNNHHKQSKKSGFKNFYTPPKLTKAAVASLLVQTNVNHHGLPSSSSLSPLRCKYCSKLFAKFTTLRKHEMLHKLNGNYHQSNSLRINPEVDVVEVNNEHSASGASANNNKSTALTLTPSLLSNLNKLANLKSSECNDGKKPAILININTNDTPQQVESAKKSQEMPLNSSSGLMISSVSSVDKNYYDTIEKQREAAAAAAATVFIQNGKKAVSLAELQCPICKKIVSQPFSLKVHLRTHTMEKPYSCPVCKKSFSQSCNLKTHMNIHNKHQFNQHSNNNNNTGSPLVCNICKKTFLKASSLNTHMISHTAKLYCYACNINFDDDAVTYSQHMQLTHNVIMTKDLISRAKANLQRSESMNQQQEVSVDEEKINGNERTKEEADQPRLKEVFQVQSSSATNGQIPKLKITIKKEPMIKQEKEDGHESDSSSSSSSSSNSSSSSSSSGSSSSSTSNNNSNDEKNDNNNR